MNLNKQRGQKQSDHMPISQDSTIRLNIGTSIKLKIWFEDRPGSQKAQ